MYPLRKKAFVPDKLSYTRNNGPVDELIDQLIGLAGGIHRGEIIRELILTTLKAGQEDNDRADLKLMNSTLKEMRFTSKAFGPYSHTRKVTVFGSARSGPDELIYRMARDLGRRLAEEGYMIITGGGPGIMQAANEGAGPERSFGVNIRLPFEQKANPVLEGSPRNINYKYFFNRKVAFLKESDAVVLFPGGFGTMDEAFETLTLVQTGKRNPMPLILLEEPGGTYWNGWVRFIEKELFGRGLISGTDFHLFQILNAVDDAVTMIDRFYRRYHSLRYVGEQLVIRLSSPLPAESVQRIKGRFSEILMPGGDLRLSNALEEEKDEPETAELPRLVLDFNRENFGGLRALIDAINRE